MRRTTTLLATLVLLGAVGCADNEPDDNANNNNLPVDGGLPGPKLYSISPTEGPLDGSTLVELHGEDFWGELTVTFGGEPATEVTVVSDGLATCVTPTGAEPGPVTVHVENVQRQFAELAGAFTYLAPPAEVTWCALDRPAALALDEGQPSQPVFGWVYAEGLTDGVGPGGGLRAQLGFGPAGSDPATSGDWTWGEAVYAADASGLYDEYVASLTPDASGLFDYAYRFSDDDGESWLLCDLDASDNGYASDQAGKLTVGDIPDDIVVTGVDLPRGSVAGGAIVTVDGSGFAGGADVLFGGAVSPQVTFVSSQELSAEVPAGSAGMVDVTVVNPGGATGILTGGFEYLLVGSPTVDGDLGEWTTPYQVAVNSVFPSSWGTGNELHELYVAYDATSLYVGVAGWVEGANAIVAYLDVDFGASTGITDTAAVTDQTGVLDNALSGDPTNGSLVFNVGGFGADFAFGSLGMAEDLAALSASAGWRRLDTPSDLYWLTATVDAGSGLLECSVPLADLWPGGVPAAGVEAALVMKIANGAGQQFADQTLPEEAATDTVGQVFTFSVYPPGTY